MIHFVESLTIYSWLWIVLPHLLRTRPKTCYVFEATPWAMRLARGSARLLMVNTEFIQYHYVDVRDETGLSIGRRIAYFDLAEIQASILKEPPIRVLEEVGFLQRHLKIFLAKQIVYGGLYFHRESLERAIFIIQVVKWYLRKNYVVNNDTVLFLERRVWSKSIEAYAAKNGIKGKALLPVKSKRRLRLKLRRLLKIRCLYRIRSWYMRLYGGEQSAIALSNEPLSQISQIKMAVEYYGYFNLDHPECYSDLFFWQQSHFCGQNLLLTFGIAKDPLNHEKLIALRSYGISAMAMNRYARSCMEAPLFVPQRHNATSNTTLSWPIQTRGTPEHYWLAGQIGEYLDERSYWEEFFSSHNVKMYLTWFKHGAQHCAIADVLHNMNGITAVYQRSYEEIPLVGLTTTADVEFAFSSAHAEVERRSGSIIPYHVVTGYLGDHRFTLLREKAAILRGALKERGAQHIVAFCDENTLADPRWHKGHEFTQQNYAFLLNKVLTKPWFGLIIKPKSPATIRQRLGPVAELLECAEHTGRCYVYEEGTVNSIHPPALAALSADLTIHEHLYAATAGMESALAGVPTLLMDRDGWQISALYRLGSGKVVFTDWDSVWEACCEHWKTPGGTPGFGDWSPMLKELDPFRDGRAAERMGTYLQWLLVGLQKGLDRDTVMAYAAERYCKNWGNDKVSSINFR